MNYEWWFGSKNKTGIIFNTDEKTEITIFVDGEEHISIATDEEMLNLAWMVNSVVVELMEHKNIETIKDLSEVCI